MRKLIRPLITAVYILGMGYAVWQGVMKPYYNWDMLCYIGSVVSWSEKDPEQIYAKTMATAKENIPDWVYKQHAESKLSNDYKPFNTIVPLCQIKPLYTGSVWLLHQTGLSLPRASWTVSNLSILAIAVLGFLWRPQFMHQSAWRLLLLGIMFLGQYPMTSLGQMSTPDALGTMLTFAAFFAWLQKKNFWGFCILGWLATLARPDAMIIISASAAYFTLLAPAEWKFRLKDGIIMLCLLVTSYLSFKHAFGSYTFDQYFIHSLVELSTNPGAITKKLTLDLWWWIFKGSFVVLIIEPRVVFLGLFMVVALISLYLKPKPPRRLWRDLLLLTFACWGARFTIWPTYEYRFYFAYSLMMLLTAGELISPFITTIRRNLIEQRKADLAKSAEIPTPTA